MDGQLFDDLTARLHAPDLQNRLASLMSIVLFALCLWLVVRIGWTLLSPVPLATDLVQTSNPRIAPANPVVPVENLSRWHLFGEFEAAPALDALRYAPVTSLQLELRGIIAGSDPESGYAIVYAQGRQAAYGIGEMVADDARVRAIYPDRVVLSRDGMHETLRLPQRRPENPPANARQEPGVAASPDSGGSATQAPMTAALAGVQELLGANGGNASGMGLVPVSGGGYRLFLSRDAAAIAKLGLRNGDVILSANGRTLASEENVERAVQQVLGGEPLRLSIRRGGEVIVLTPDLSSLQ